MGNPYGAHICAHIRPIWVSPGHVGVMLMQLQRQTRTCVFNTDTVIRYDTIGETRASLNDATCALTILWEGVATGSFRCTRVIVEFVASVQFLQKKRYLVNSFRVSY